VGRMRTEIVHTSSRNASRTNVRRAQFDRNAAQNAVSNWLKLFLAWLNQGPGRRNARILRLQRPSVKMAGRYNC
jgi:hypothetical protein